MMKKKEPKMRHRYIVRSREWTLKSRKRAVARSFTNPYTPEARSEFVLSVYPVIHEDYQLVRSSDVVEKTYLDRALSNPLLEVADHHRGAWRQSPLNISEVNWVIIIQ